LEPFRTDASRIRSLCAAIAPRFGIEDTLHSGK
jgi:hypothetical protein